jgi:hypothetical protein
MNGLQKFRKICNILVACYRADIIIAEALARDSYAEAVKIITLIEEKVK